MNYTNKIIGIWGYGLVGKSVASFLYAKGARILVFDDNAATSILPEYAAVKSHEKLFELTDYIVPSPGVNTQPYRHLYTNWLCELDIFQSYCNAKVIAVTGSAGKTTIVHTLTHYLKSAGHTAIAAGNIGLPMLSVIDRQTNYEYIVLEVSSFQLEYAQTFKPYMSIITNIHPNHLDRHGSMEAYRTAKLNILSNNTRESITLLPENLRNTTHVKLIGTVFYFDQINQLDSKFEKINTPLTINKRIIASALSLLNIPIEPTKIPALEHRLEYVATINTVAFYNDSKSTTPASTLSAISACSSSDLFLIIGGLSKGVDRETLIKAIPDNVTVFCFGAESNTLYALCKKYNLTSRKAPTLDEVFNVCMQYAQPHTTILFSPSGSSFDLFDNFAHRGNEFKKLVDQYKKNNTYR